MELGLSIPHTGKLASPAYVKDFCQTADDLGFGALWAADHIVMPQSIESEYTLARRPARMQDGSVSNLLSPNYESTSTLLWVAGLTSRVKLATGVSVLPIRNPLYNARQLATLDVYSGGRLWYGVGVGWLKEEADALHMPWDHRGARSDEHIALLRAVWLAEGDLVSFDGEWYSFPDIDPEPRPVQQPPPILIGGHSDAALRRAGRTGDGWIASRMSMERLQEHWPKVRANAKDAGRDPDTLILVNSAPVPCTDDADRPLTDDPDELLERLNDYKAYGVTHLHLTVDATTRDGSLAAVQALGQLTGEVR
jgi:probable F420-dependent oxidoreductase